MLPSTAELAAQIGPQLAAILRAHQDEITAQVHPALARWAVGRILTAIEPHLGELADHVISWLAAKLKDMKMGDVAAFVEHLVATSDFQPAPVLLPFRSSSPPSDTETT